MWDKKNTAGLKAFIEKELNDGCDPRNLLEEAMWFAFECTADKAFSLKIHIPESKVKLMISAAIKKRVANE